MRPATATAPGPGLPALHGRILAASADASERRWLAASLGAFGLQSAFAADSDALLQAFLGGEFDLVIIDAALPGGAGDACALIHRQDPAMPVVLLGGPAGMGGHSRVATLRRPLDRRRLHGLLSGRLRRLEDSAVPLSGDDGELAAQLAELRRAYVRRLDTSVLQPLRAAATTGDWPALRQLSHRLSGTAGCHGLAALAAAAAALEAALQLPAPSAESIDPLLAAVAAAVADTLAEEIR